MNSIIFGIGLLSILVAVVILVFRPYDYGADVKAFKKIGDSDETGDKSADTQWRSVKIRPGLIACNSIQQMAGQVYLSKEAPTLPLKNCTERDCRCFYTFHEDRRSGKDRRVELARLKGLFKDFENDRRRLPGRRLADLAI